MLIASELACQRCGKAYPPREGRGIQSPFCEDCRRIRRRHQSKLRGIRHGMAQLDEWTVALGPRIIQWKEEIVERQGGLCRSCGRHRTLYFAVDEDDQLYGLCLTCHEAWINTKKKEKP